MTVLAAVSVNPTPAARIPSCGQIAIIISAKMSSEISIAEASQHDLLTC
jgi:hypothetical protein